MHQVEVAGIEGTITRLKVQAKNEDRVNVYLDGEFAFGMAKILAVGLQVGDRLSEAEIDQLQDKDAFEEARRRALRLIGRRPRSEQELRRYFKGRELPDALQTAVIDSLRQSGLVDDRAFAEKWVENRSEYRPRGAFALRQELKQKGVGRSEIEAALASFDEEEAAYKAGEEAARRYKDLSEREFRRKASGYLGRRGFPYGLISTVVDAMWQQIAAEDESEGTW